MYGFTIGQKNHTEKPVLHFRHLHPTPNPAISLDYFPERHPYSSLDPFLSDYRPIRSLTDCLEIARDLHTDKVADFRCAGLSCRNL
jgi:hypothetical protein